MHLLISHASALGEAADAALALLARQGLPRLGQLLGRLQADPPAAEGDAAPDEYSLNTPHERATLQAAGWPAAADGQLPWAAWLARQDGLALPPGSAVGLVSPVHWNVGSDKISLVDPAQLSLAELESRAMMAVLQELVAEHGWQLHHGAPQRWYAVAPLMAQVRSASLERVIGRNIDLWLPRDQDARIVRRLQVELQMTLHEHPLTAEREARRELPVNSFWLSGTGVVPDSVTGGTALPASLRIDSRLGAPLLAGDWQAWCDAWQALDAGPVAELLEASRAGTPVRLTLCGERTAQSWTPRPIGLLEKLGLRKPQADAITTLRTL